MTRNRKVFAFQNLSISFPENIRSPRFPNIVGMHFNIITLILIASVIAISHSLEHDDLIVAVGDRLEFLDKATTARNLTFDSYKATKLSALVYDPATRKLFFSDRRSLRGHIFSALLDESAPALVVEDIVEKNSNETVEGLTYDPLDRTLLWTDGLNRSIRRVKIDHDHIHIKENTAIELVHFLDKDDKPRGLVSDPCNRMLYWTNRYMDRPTIERSHLDGSQREVVVENNLLLPHALDLDIKEQKIYWANNQRQGYFDIERSYVNGSHREIVYRGIGQFIVSLTVGKDYVYWSDSDGSGLWATPKHGGEGPIHLRQYQHGPAMGLAIYRREALNCDLVSSAEHIDRVDEETAALPEEHHHAPSTDQGLCFDGFCLNQGQCSIVDADIQCRCALGFSGHRCEVVDAGHVNAWSCYALVGGLTQAETILMASLTITCAVLIIVVLFLCYRLWKLTGSKRPRMLRRRILKRLDCNDSVQNENAPIEDLENCCNSISLCERPCPQQAKGGPAKQNDCRKDTDTSALLRNEFYGDI